MKSMQSRRTFLNRIALGAAAFTTPGLFAEELVRTPRQTAGPFYPDKLPLDTDNDLLIINDGITPAVGEITHLSGRVLDARGDAIRNALVEIWQTDTSGTYLHTKSSGRNKWDNNFQGFGKFMTGATGEYYFRTIKPTAYRDGGLVRTPHIHVAVHVKGQRRFTTQCYVKGEELNKQDRILNSVRDAKAKESIIVDFQPLPDSRTGEVAGTFDIVLGFTPEA